jgi:hypothetical protein
MRQILPLTRTIAVIAAVLGGSTGCSQDDAERNGDGGADGFELEPEPARSDTDRACSLVDPAVCAERSECGALQGRPLDVARACWKPLQAAGCREGPERRCGARVTVAKDPSRAVKAMSQLDSANRSDGRARAAGRTSSRSTAAARLGSPSAVSGAGRPG